MIVELAVSDLGVIDRLSVVVGRGMTALTGETGAGKTLVVQAIDLLCGGRAEPGLVRPGADEARVEGRFETDDGDEVVLTRVIPAGGRSRAYVNGSMATAAALAEHGRLLVDLHGQHAHQSLLSGPVQRELLDAYAGIDLGPLSEARAAVRDLEQRLDGLGGDARARAHELDLLRFQLAEIEAAAIEGPDEVDRLRDEESVLADAGAHLAAGEAARAALADDGGAADTIGAAFAEIAERLPYIDVAPRLRALAAEVDDAVAELRGVVEAIEDDPERLATVQQRRQVLRDLRQKYGDSLGDVLTFAERSAARVDELERHGEIAADLEVELVDARAAVADRAAEVARARRAAAPELAKTVTGHLADLALPRAEVAVTVAGDDPGDDVEFGFDANGEGNIQPLTRVASGGELARVMLAFRLVLTAGPSTLVFDEVDAGIGGEAAVAVGRSLAALAPDHQVLVVTHLPQVAAFADQHLVVSKDEVDGRVQSGLADVNGDERVVELARMLAGQPDSSTGRAHATELLAAAAADRPGR